jgi:DNA gyrase subunit A
MPVDGLRRMGRATQGVIVMRLRGDERVSSLAPVVEPEEPEEPEEPGEPTADAEPAAEFDEPDADEDEDEDEEPVEDDDADADEE